MPSYLVTWEIDIEADTPREAAEKARAVQRDPSSWATAFTVQAPIGTPVSIDLDQAA